MLDSRVPDLIKTTATAGGEHLAASYLHIHPGGCGEQLFEGLGLLAQEKVGWRGHCWQGSNKCIGVRA